MSTIYRDDTICALATGAHAGGVGIIRVSGPDTRAIIAKISRRPKTVLEPLRLQFTEFVDGDGQVIDEGYVAWMPGPRSYTCEDCAEFHGHGGPTNLRRLLATVVNAGARVAERGEFTLRAFLNGRIDLSQAEAVLDIVQARTETALDLAQKQLRGGISQRVNSVRESLIDAIALLEAQIDFVEEDLDDAHGQRPTALLAKARDNIASMSRTFNRGKVLREGVRIVLLGPPNAGKSSLFNALLKTSRAIVTNIPGTTRDFLEETLDLDGIPVTLIDTAGLRDPSDPVEAAGVERAIALACDADVVLVLDDATTDAVVPLPNELANKNNVIHIRTKADLTPADISVVTGFGIESLVQRIRTLVLPEDSDATGHALVTSARHHDALISAHEALCRAVDASISESPDIIAVEVQEALSQLGLIVGETTTDDLLDRIFSTFCIGK